MVDRYIDRYIGSVGQGKGAVAPVVHEEELEFLGGVDKELVEAVGEEVSGFLVRAYVVDNSYQKEV